MMVPKATLKIAAVAAGITLALCFALGSLLWQVSKPKAQTPWNESAIVASDAPSFDRFTENDPTISLAYSVENATDSDYSIDTPQQARLLAVLGDGILSEPINSDKAEIRTPVFIPAHRMGSIVIHLKAFQAPERGQESGEAYRERVRQSMNERMGNIHSFILFDEVNRYQINLKRWAATKPEKRP